MKTNTLHSVASEPQTNTEAQMDPKPEFIKATYRGSDKLKNKVALITGGDSGIGRAVAVHFAREGADVSIIYLKEHQDALDTQQLVENEGKRCLLIAGDVGDPQFCHEAVAKTVQKFGKIDILVNNAAEQHVQPDIQEIGPQQLEQTFRTNIFAYFFMVQACLPHFPDGGNIINTTSVTAYQGSKDLIDYSATKGAIVAFTRSLSQSLIQRGIRVNAVAPGPIWTPLIASSFNEEKIKTFGSNYPMGRPGQPSEVAPSFVFLASEDSTFMSGQVLHPNGGKIVNG